jgi:hypothetical protein
LPLLYEILEQIKDPLYDLYTKAEPAALGIFDAFYKTSFATLSRCEPTSPLAL